MEPRRRRWVGCVAGVALVALAATACRETATSPQPVATNDTVGHSNTGVIESTDTPRPGGKIVYGLMAETNGWNPATNQWGPSGLQVTNAIFDTLIAYDEHSAFKPFLAESFDHSADGKQWTFKLRPNVTMHNGKAVTADVIIRNQTYLWKSPITKPAYTYANIVEFAKKDDLTFVVTLSRPSVMFPIFFATQLGVVADPDWLESNDGVHPIGTGPFAIDSWDIGKQLVVKKNPNYWRVDARGARLPYLDSVEFRIMPDAATQTAALQSGDLDLSETLNGAQIQQFQKDKAFQVYTDSKGESREQFVQLNTKVAPFDDPDARRALAYATDKKAYSDAMSEGFDEPADGPIAAGSPWFTDTDYPQYDPERAKELVDKVKASHGGTFAFRLQGADDAELVLGAQILKEQWAKVGIDTTLDSKDQAKNIIEVLAGSYQSTMFHQFDAPNPIADGVWWDAQGAKAPPEWTLNFARNDDQQITDALHAAITKPGFDDQKHEFDIVQQRIAADVPYIWLVHQRISLIASNRLVNLVHATLPDGSIALDMQQGAHHLDQIWLRT